MTAHAVGGLADSGIVQRLTQSRAWIALLGALLAGIVAANLYALSLSASSAQTATTADELARENSILQSRTSRLLGGGRAESVGASGSMLVPSPDSISYLRAGSADAARAADRLLGGEIAVVMLEIVAEVIPAEPVVAADPVAEVPAEPIAPVEPAPAEPVPAEPVEPAVEAPPVESAPAPAGTAPAGGVSG